VRIEVVSLFPEEVLAVGRFGVVGRAAQGGLVSLGAVNPRDYTADVHRTVDDRPYGGGPGMVMKFEPLAAAIDAAAERAGAGARVVHLSPQGRRFDQALAREYAALPALVLVAGRYEGVDERLIEARVDEEVSVGDFVLSGGEIAAMVVIDATVRLLPGVLGDAESAVQESFETGLLDCPHYTRPEVVDGRRVPEVLTSGDHAAIARWRLKQSLGRTWARRPELLSGRALTDEERELLEEYKAEAEEAGAG
jgi:tRNA (guanine37-N1)-methyltransferase